MKYNLFVKGIDKTEAIENYLDKKLATLDHLMPKGEEDTMAEVEIGKTTRHHNKGDVFRAEVKIRLAHKNIYVASEKDDLYAAIDEMRDEAASAITTRKDKQITLYRKGALAMKNFIKGFGNIKWRRPRQ